MLFDKASKANELVFFPIPHRKKTW